MRLIQQKVTKTNTASYSCSGSVLIGMETYQGTIMRFSYDASGSVVAVDYSTNNGLSFDTYYYVRNAQNDVVKRNGDPEPSI